ncbi:MAG: hypothetical protein M1830_010033, partial [Pleopsidium flavum]
VWQKKLSSLGVAQFPWDPAPPPTIVNTPTLPSNAARPQSVPSPSSGPPPIGVRVKMEPGYDNPLSSLPHATVVHASTTNSQAAQQRAAALMAQKYGAQADPQIAQLQAGIALPGQQRPQGLQMPIAQNKDLMKQQNLQQLQQAQRANIESAQFDGAADTHNEDWNAVAVRRLADGNGEQIGRMHADRTIRMQIERLGQRMEGGGLMVPLEDRPHTREKKKRKAVAPAQAPVPTSTPTAGHSSSLTALKLAQYDGVDESDEDDKTGIKHDSDEDAINSDLDDPNDNVGEEEEDDEGAGQTMLCTYDKVQRVKNKWKCTLKDGVLTTNGKEFVLP